LTCEAFSEFANIDILKTDFDGLKRIATAHDLCTDFVGSIPAQGEVYNIM
jgi:hypothetical protein